MKRFLTTLSDGLAPVWFGDPQNSIRAAAELDERDWRIWFSSFCVLSADSLGATYLDGIHDGFNYRPDFGGYSL